MSRFARGRRVFFVEEPIFEMRAKPGLKVAVCEKTGVRVVTPQLPNKWAAVAETVGALMEGFFRNQGIDGGHVNWYYTPMALDYTPEAPCAATVYDCMDELSLFQGAPPQLCKNEAKLFDRCDLVFTGGVSLFEAKRRQHDRVYPFPSSVDVAHFAKARNLGDVAADQKDLARPRLGYAGVIDERIDLNLIAQLAEMRPGWQIVMIGPVVKIDQALLPRRDNIHWLGMKDYSELPKYFAGWDVALMPFAMNDATKFISPTKTPEYLAAGLPVVSTPIRDVARQYGALGLARIAGNTRDFVAAADQSLTYGVNLKTRQRTDAYLRTLSWDQTFCAMDRLIEEAIEANRATADQAVKTLTASQAIGSYYQPPAKASD